MMRYIFKLTSILLTMLLIGCFGIKHYKKKSYYERKGHYKIDKTYNDTALDEHRSIVKGYMLDENGKIIKYCTLSIVSKTTEYNIKVDSVGYFNDTIPSGMYILLPRCVGKDVIRTEMIEFKSKQIVIINFEVGETVMYQK